MKESDYEVGEHLEASLNVAFGYSAIKLGDPIQIGSSKQVFKVIKVSSTSITVCPYDYTEPAKTKPAPKPKHQAPAKQFTEFGRNKVRIKN